MEQSRCIFDNSNHCTCVGNNDNLKVITIKDRKSEKEKEESCLAQLIKNTVTFGCLEGTYLNRKKYF